ncbi:hypothetical protein Dimus_022680, partial [Dionaea muscipula]
SLSGSVPKIVLDESQFPPSSLDEQRVTPIPTQDDDNVTAPIVINAPDPSETS